MTEVVRVDPGRYHDSVTLMRASAAAADLPGVDTVIAAMATELNRALLDDAGFPPSDAGPDDLVVAVRAGSDDTAEQALETVDAVLAERARPARSGVGTRVPPHTVEAAASLAPEAPVVVVSVPGPHAYVEAAAALRAGRHAMVFSDGVDLAAEVALKHEATARGRLVMGPDCGTVILGGVGLGFANVVVPGPVGIVAASGTGAQQLCCLLDGAGIGVRHVLGVGGRDLSAAVGGASALAALALLDAEPAVEVIALVSKPPAPEVAAAVAAAAAACATPVVLAPVGPGQPTLTAAAARVADVVGVAFPAPASSRPHVAAVPRPGPLLGLFSGGTNCVEATAVVEEVIGPVRSNVHPDPAWRVPADHRPGGDHVLVDLGDDELTAGRPHPMIDPAPVAERLVAAASPGEDGVGGAREAGRARGAGVVVLDVVLGHGAHPDPAAVLASPLADVRGAGVATVVALVGTAGDPQGLDRQARALVDAGAVVHRSVAAAAAEAASLVATARSTS
jgi:FdrA protein